MLNNKSNAFYNPADFRGDFHPGADDNFVFVPENCRGQFLQAARQTSSPKPPTQTPQQQAHSQERAIQPH